jgi:hypothetical protein
MIHHKKLKFVLELTDDRIKGKLGKPFGKKKVLTRCALFYLIDREWCWAAPIRINAKAIEFEFGL